MAGLIKLKRDALECAEISISAGLTPQTSSSLEKPQLRYYDLSRALGD